MATAIPAKYLSPTAACVRHGVTGRSSGHAVRWAWNIVRLTRRRSLLGLGGLFAAALGAGAAKATDGTALPGSPPARSSASSRPEMTKGPYYISGEKLRRDISDGQAGRRGSISRSPSSTPRRCRPIKRRDRGHLALRRRRRLLRLRRGRLEPHVPARHAEDGRARRRPLQDDLSRLVSRPRGAHPREGARAAATSSTPASSSSPTR